MGRRPGSRTATTHEDREDLYDAMVDRRGPDDCWPWLGTHNGNGYGRFWDGERYRSAAAYGFEVKVGPMPAGKEVCHTCNTRDCQNPAHWYDGTRVQNQADSIASGTKTKPPPTPRVLTDEQEDQVRRLYASGGTSHRRLATQFGVSSTTIGKVLS